MELEPKAAEIKMLKSVYPIHCIFTLFWAPQHYYFKRKESEVTLYCKFLQFSFDPERLSYKLGSPLHKSVPFRTFTKPYLVCQVWLYCCSWTWSLVHSMVTSRLDFNSIRLKIQEFPPYEQTPYKQFQSSAVQKSSITRMTYLSTFAALLSLFHVSC